MKQAADQSDVRALRASIELMCRAVAPRDLAAVPVYIVFASEAPELAGAVRGWTHTAAADALRPNIADWRGPGVAMLLNDVLIGQELDALLPGLPAKRREAYIEANLRDTALHEMAHILVDGVTYRPLSCPPEAFAAAITRWAIEAAWKCNSVGRRPPEA